MNIPHDMIDGRPIFHKARHRDMARVIMDLPEPRHEPLELKIRDPLCRFRSGQYHWSYSKCVQANFSKWTRYTRMLVVGGGPFMEKEKHQQCPSCRAEFENS